MNSIFALYFSLAFLLFPWRSIDRSCSYPSYDALYRKGGIQSHSPKKTPPNHNRFPFKADMVYSNHRRARHRQMKNVFQFVASRAHTAVATETTKLFQYLIRKWNWIISKRLFFPETCFSPFYFYIFVHFIKCFTFPPIFRATSSESRVDGGGHGTNGNRKCTGHE